MGNSGERKAPPIAVENTAARTFNELKYPIAKSYADIVYTIVRKMNALLDYACSCWQFRDRRARPILWTCLQLHIYSLFCITCESPWLEWLIQLKSFVVVPLVHLRFHRLRDGSYMSPRSSTHSESLFERNTQKERPNWTQNRRTLPGGRSPKSHYLPTSCPPWCCSTPFPSTVWCQSTGSCTRSHGLLFPACRWCSQFASQGCPSGTSVPSFALPRSMTVAWAPGVPAKTHRGNPFSSRSDLPIPTQYSLRPFKRSNSEWHAYQAPRSNRHKTQRTHFPRFCQ